VINDIVEPNTPVVTEKKIGLGSYADSGYKGALITPEERIHSDGDLNLWIQSGAEAGDGMFITIGVMDADTLGMTGLDVTTEEGAGKAIDAAGKATQIVSELRSSIGAQQNRLEHTYKNVTNTAENTQAAESRIRDTDMAKEMVELSKHNILEQVGTSMIAQANQSNQGVLSLLQ
jgi:flagellin-like hook-associated protein FlgL